jgi:hypothetical protein
MRDSARVIESSPGSGFTIGIVSNLRLGEYFDLRFNPDLSFSERFINYKIRFGAKPDSLINKTIESTLMQFPIELKFKSKRVNNYRVFVLGGVKYSYDWAAKELIQNLDGSSAVKYLRLKRNDFGYQAGLGIDMYLQYFKFAVELKVYRGLGNIYERRDNNTVYSSSINTLNSHLWMLSFTFE